jgi:predicted methyltransferase
VIVVPLHVSTLSRVLKQLTAYWAASMTFRNLFRRIQEIVKREEMFRMIQREEISVQLFYDIMKLLGDEKLTEMCQILIFF